MAATPIFPGTIKNWALTIQNSDGTNVLTLATAGANGSQINAINISSTDSTSRDIKLYFSNGVTNFLIATFSVIGSAGNNSSTYPIDALKIPNMFALPYNAEGNRIIYLQSGWSLKVNVTSTVTSAQQIQIVALGGDY